MKHLTPYLLLSVLLIASCTSQKKLAYLNNLPETGGEETFTMDIPDYKIQPRDILYITIKAMTPDGTIIDFLSSSRSQGGSHIRRVNQADIFMAMMLILRGILSSGYWEQ